jgi:hypothetical protein
VTRGWRVVMSLGVCLALALAAPSGVGAEDKKPTKSQHKVRKKRARASRPPAPAKPAERPDERNATTPRHDRRGKREAQASADTSAASAAQAAASATQAQIVKEGDTSVKVMSFEGLGIEGRLKSPQLVYFVQRVQAEFERPTLPHRSFIPELTDSTARGPVR